MDFIQVLGAAIVFGSTLGATLAGLFASRQRSLVKLLREANNDYKERVEQLEKDRDDDRRTIQQQAAEIKQLKSEKALPLQQLTKLIVSQHAETMAAVKRSK